MKKNNIITLNNGLIQCLKLIVPPREYKLEAYLYYEGHVPHVGFLVVDGEVIAEKRNKEIQSFSTGSLIGVGQMMEKKAIDCSFKIGPGTHVCIIDRSTVLELAQGQGHPFSTFIKVG
jgi:hypothetical protein